MRARQTDITRLSRGDVDQFEGNLRAENASRFGKPFFIEDTFVMLAVAIVLVLTGIAILYLVNSPLLYSGVPAWPSEVPPGQVHGLPTGP